jgi:carboxymethylenebutenolidase
LRKARIEVTRRPAFSASAISRAAGLLLLLCPVAAAQEAHGDHAQAAAPAAVELPARTGKDALPAAEAQAKDALEKSPRHGEWVDVPVTGAKPIRAWVVYPERKDKAPVVIVIQEIFGLTDWIRAVADQLARDGFIAVAPDLLTGKGPNGGNSDAFASRDDVVKAVRGLEASDVDHMLDAVRQYGLGIPAGNGKIGTVGFCWGGSTSFRYATHQPMLGAAVVYYGSAPDAAALATVQAPVLGLYGGDDERVNATIARAQSEMKKLGQSYVPHVFEGAGHGFLRAQTERDGANRRAAEQAWPLTVKFLQQHLK